jgi:hypothetical protein
MMAEAIAAELPENPVAHEAIAPEFGIAFRNLPAAPGFLAAEVAEEKIAHHGQGLALSGKGIGHLPPVKNGIAIGKHEHIGIVPHLPINIFYRTGIKQVPENLGIGQRFRGSTHGYSPFSR